jgi:hypothetical protein
LIALFAVHLWNLAVWNGMNKDVPPRNAAEKQAQITEGQRKFGTAIKKTCEYQQADEPDQHKEGFREIVF